MSRCHRRQSPFIHSPRTQSRTHRHQRRAFYLRGSNTGQFSLYPIRHTNRSTVHREENRQANPRETHLPQCRSTKPPAQILYKIRERWNVENKNHQPRDAIMLGDKCRYRTRNTAAKLALLRGVTLTIWKKAEPNRTAPDFIRSNQRNVDSKITLIYENERLINMKRGTLVRLVAHILRGLMTLLDCTVNRYQIVFVK